MKHLRKVWLIGAHSFTGTHLIPNLEKDEYHVDTTEVDITDLQQVTQAMLRIEPDYIISLAAISFVPDGGDESIYAVNTFGAQNILAACLKLQKAPKNIILASSANIYGIQAQEQVDENCMPNPINHYGCSKWSMEQIAQTYSEQLNITITRPFNYTGRGQDSRFLVPKIIEHFIDKAPILKLGNIDVSRDFSDVRWISEAYTNLLSIPTKGVTKINLCSGKLISIRKIIALLQEITGHQMGVETDGSLVRKADIQCQYGNNNKLFSVVPNLSSAIEFSETLKWMLQSK